MYQLATAPRGIGQALDSIIQLTRTSFLRMLPYAILATLMSALPFVYLLYSGVLDNPALAAQVIFSRGYWLTILVMIPVSMLLYGASIVRIESIAQGADVGIGSSFRSDPAAGSRADRRHDRLHAGDRASVSRSSSSRASTCWARSFSSCRRSCSTARGPSRASTTVTSW